MPIRATAVHLGWLLLLLLILRLPAFVYGPVDIDETDLMVCGRMLGEGALPYVDFVEKKPPLSYLFYSPAALFGWHLWPLQLLAVVWLFATCIVVGLVAARVYGADTGRAAAVLCGLVSSANVPSVNTELMLNLPAAAALYFHVRSDRRRDLFASGLCVGLATLFKHQAGVLLVALTLASMYRVRAVKLRHALIAAGCALPWLAVATLYARRGHVAEFYDWNVTRNLDYLSSTVGSAGLRFVSSFGLICVLGSGLVWWLALRQTLRRGAHPAFTLALALTWIPICLGGRFYEHYFLQLAPPLALVAAPELARGFAAHRRLYAALLVAPPIAFSLFAWTWGALGRFPSQEPRARSLAVWLHEHSTPAERLFVWGHFTPIYYFSRRLPGTRYYNTANHIGDFDPHHLPAGFDVRPYISARDVAQTLADLERNRPAFVVDTAPADIHQWGKVPLAAVPALRAYVDEHYVEVARPSGVPVYQRRTSGLE